MDRNEAHHAKHSNHTPAQSHSSVHSASATSSQSTLHSTRGTAHPHHSDPISPPKDLRKRQFLARLTTFLGGIGLLAAVFPFLAAWRPSERARALGGPITVDISALQPGEKMTVEWRGKPIWIIRRSREMLNTLSIDENQLRDPQSHHSVQPAYARNRYRSLQEEFLVLIGICTHLGCSPTFRPQQGELGAKWSGGFFCPCHGSSFDLAGRVFKGVPAPTNLQVPPYRFADPHQLIIGEEAVA